MSAYCEDPVFYSYSEPVARKQYKCCECRAPILEGEKHFCCTGKWDGSIDTYRQHFTCMEACMLIRDEFDGECIPFGSLQEEFQEIRGDGWYPKRERWKPAWKRLRSLMAQILWRERPYRIRRQRITDPSGR